MLHAILSVIFSGAAKIIRLGKHRTRSAVPTDSGPDKCYTAAIYSTLFWFASPIAGLAITTERGNWKRMPGSFCSHFAL